MSDTGGLVARAAPQERDGVTSSRPPAQRYRRRAASVAGQDPSAEPDARPPLLAPPDLAGPKVVLGIVWAAVTGVTLLTSSVLLGVWLAVVAGLAGVQAARSWKRHPDRRPHPPAAGVGALIAVLGACLGVIGFAVAAFVGIVVTAVWATLAATQRQGDQASGADVVLTLACMALPAAAAASPVLLRSNGLVPALVLVVYALVHDASAFLIGAGARRPWEGPLAGVASIASVTLAVAAVFPQFKGASPWVLGVLAALLTPLGPVVASLVVGSRRARIPALRRLDSLMVLGPLWALAAAVLVG